MATFNSEAYRAALMEAKPAIMAFIDESNANRAPSLARNALVTDSSPGPTQPFCTHCG